MISLERDRRVSTNGQKYVPYPQGVTEGRAASFIVVKASRGGQGAVGIGGRTAERTRTRQIVLLEFVLVYSIISVCFTP
jgi:hypothetical protein